MIVNLKEFIRDVPDFPKKGIMFKDITPLLGSPDALRAAVSAMLEGAGPVDLVAAVEARGFILGGAIAERLGIGFVPVRKAGKLPHETVREEYALEYGTDALEIHKDAVRAGQRVLLVDDVLATGGTARAAARLVEKCGGQVARICFLVELAFLDGRTKIDGYPVTVAIRF